MSGDPAPGGYAPDVVVRRPGGWDPVVVHPHESQPPRYRVLMHKRLQETWNRLVSDVSTETARHLWDHLAYRPDRPPLLGTSTPLRGGQAAGRGGWSRAYHYEVTGPGRVDYQYHPAFTGGGDGDPHPVAKILRITLGSH